jgi:hypothetical protein
MECPYCGKKIEDGCTHCRFCGHCIIEESPSIASFLTKNANLFAAIGLIGTMIALMPNFADKLNNEIWLGSLSSYQIFFLFLAINAGLIFIFILFVVMMIKYNKNNLNLSFGVLLFVFSLFLISFCLFIFLSVQKYVYLQLSLLGLYLAIAILMLIGSKNEPKISKIIVGLTLLFIAILFAISLLILLYSPHPLFIEPTDNNTKIEYDVSYYTPIIPQSIGIGLIPKTNGTVNSTEYNYTWKTNYGYFVSINSGDNRILYLTNKSTNHGDKIFWTYNVNDEDIPKPVVIIEMSIQNSTDNYLLNSSLKLSWTEQNSAVKVLIEQ